MKKRMIGLFLIMTLFFTVGCSSRIVGDSATGAAVGIIEYGEAREERIGADIVPVREFTITASQKVGYTPNIFQAQKGELIRLIIYASDAKHGFVLIPYGINEFIEENNYKTIEFVADQVGEFTFFSNVYAGPGTKDMYGVLIIEE
jgi:heme/copper-type cytochrome/quinol oxidase subunit 2